MKINHLGLCAAGSTIEMSAMAEGAQKTVNQQMVSRETHVRWTEY